MINSEIRAVVLLGEPMSDQLQELITHLLVSGPTPEVVNEFEAHLREESDAFVRRSATEALVSGLVLHSTDLGRAERLCRELLEQEEEAHVMELLGVVLLAQGRESEALELRAQAREQKKELVGA